MALRLSLTLLAACAALVAPAAVSAQPGLLLGVDDDALKWAQKPAPLQQAIADLGLGTVRFTQTWQPGQSSLSTGDIQNLNHAVQNAHGLRIVLSVYGKAAAAPQDDTARRQY